MLIYVNDIENNQAYSERKTFSSSGNQQSWQVNNRNENSTRRCILKAKAYSRISQWHVLKMCSTTWPH